MCRVHAHVEGAGPDLVLIHGDYRTGNYLFDESSGEITALLDWADAANDVSSARTASGSAVSATSVPTMPKAGAWLAIVCRMWTGTQARSWPPSCTGRPPARSCP